MYILGMNKKIQDSAALSTRFIQNEKCSGNDSNFD